MRAVAAVTGVWFVIVGGLAVITGEALMHGTWAIACALAALGLLGLVRAANTVAD